MRVTIAARQRFVEGRCAPRPLRAINKKAQAERAHATRRLFERYGINLPKTGLAEIIAQVQSGKALFLARRSNRITVWRVRYQDQDVVIVYDSKRHEVVTALTPREVL